MIDAEKKKVVQTDAEEQSYRSHCVEKRVTVRRAAAAAAKSRPKRAKQSESRSLPTWPRHEIDVELARSFKPPGSSLWRCVRFGSWQGHLPPWPRLSRLWSRYGEGESLNLVLRYLWERWSESTGNDLSQCPVRGLFGPSDQSASTASASSRGARAASA